MLRKLVVGALAGAFAAVLIAGCAKGSPSGNTNSKGGHPAMDTVSGGTVMTSSSYRLVLTTGQGPGGNGTLTSTSYRIHGGLVGATQ
jgi:hypothetical protein